MNKTLTVNISGFVFNIEEQAYEQLSQYLDRIRTNFHNEEERDEIMSDIELRIAELFQEKITQSKEVIVDEDIEEIIAILGHPEEFATDEGEPKTEDESAETKSTETDTQYSGKRLFRDKDGATLGGVCSGLGYYFEADPVVFRVLFVLLFVLFGSGILLYIILLLVVPEAKTTTDKIQMKGQSVNVGSIREHISNIKQGISENTNQARIRENIKGTLDKGMKAGQSVFQIISKVLGVAFTLGGTLTFVFVMIILFGNTGILPFIGPDKVDRLQTLVEVVYPGEKPNSLIFISMVVVILIPIISIILIGVRILFNYKENAKKIAWSLVILFVIASSTLFVFSVELASDFKSDKSISYSVPYSDTGDNLILEVMDDDQFSNHINPRDDMEVEFLKVDETNIYFGLPFLHVKSTLDTGQYRITLIKSSHGESTQDAINKIERITYPISTQGNKLLIPPYMKIPRQDKIRAQYVRVEVIVPKGKSITFGNNSDRIRRYIDQEEPKWRNEYSGTRWINLNGIFHEQGVATL